MGDAMDEQFELKNYREILVDDGIKKCGKRRITFVNVNVVSVIRKL